METLNIGKLREEFNRASESVRIVSVFSPNRLIVNVLPSVRHGPCSVGTLLMAMMGANFNEYLQEAYRTLKLDGHIHIYEATSRFSDRVGFVNGLKRLGFDNVVVEDKWKFTHIHAIKVRRQQQVEDPRIRF